MLAVAETLDPGPRDLGAFCRSRPDSLSCDEGVCRLDRFLPILGWFEVLASDVLFAWFLSFLFLFSRCLFSSCDDILVELV